MIAFKINSREIVNDIFIPKYYDPELRGELRTLCGTHDLVVLGDLLEEGIMTAQTGHEIGKMAYGTGNIPFVRTSDMANWEIKAVPKQGVSVEIYEQYADKENIQDGDILLARDGTYLVGTTCFVTKMDLPLLIQSHILKFHIVDKERVDPYLFFLVMNCPLVQRQIRNMQFSADIIDTLGNRYKELVLPFPKEKARKRNLAQRMKHAIETRVKYKAAIRQMPLLIEQMLEQEDPYIFKRFFGRPVNEILEELVQDTTTLEFGEFSAFKLNSSEIRGDVYLPKYYDPSIKELLESLREKCRLVTIGDLVTRGDLELRTGDEIGKMAYGTGNIPFVRTSDMANWEIKADTKQGVSEEIYEQYASDEDVRSGDILLVRDGTYLVGTSCPITEYDAKILYCGGLYKIRTKNRRDMDEYLLLGLLNSYIVKRQIRAKQFTRDVIDTLGRRLNEVVLPIPKKSAIKEEISMSVKNIIASRILARETIPKLSQAII